MAYDSLKALIRQYIKTNGEQEITGQILQNVLVEMVNQYPSTDGYATQSWVTSQLAGYATTSQLADYLPLTGGTLTGALMTSGTTQGIQLRAYFDNDTIAIQKYENNDWVSVCSLSGPGYITGSTYHGNQYIVNNGTSDQFLKADGSVDSNTYITASALTGYATQSWVTTQLGSYLPLTGGTLTGALMTSGTTQGIQLRAYFDNDTIAIQKYENNDWVSVCSLSGPGYITGSTYHGNQYIVNNGTSSQFLKADGSVDSNTYITASALTGYATQSWVTTQLGSYLPLTGGTLTGALMTSGTTIGIQLRAYFDNDTIAIQKYENNDWVSVCSLSGTGYITGTTYHGNQYIVNNGTSSQFMKADGSLDSNTYITASALTGYATQSWVTTQLGSYNPTTNFKTINNQSIIGTGNINIEGGGGGAYYDAEIEYLEGTGTQWIDTGILITSSYKIELSVIGKNTTDTAIFGTNNGSVYDKGEMALTSAGNVFNIIYPTSNSSSSYRSLPYTVGTKYDISCTFSSWTINGNTDTFSAYQSYVANRTLYIFATNRGSAVGPYSGKLYYFKIYNGTTLVFDAIPVRVGQVGYLYDKVSGQLFGNQGTGSFVLGPDKEYLPLTGGTITGNLTIKNSKAVSSTLYIIDGEGSYTHRIVADDDGLNIYCGNDLYFNAVGDFYFVNKSVAVGTYSTSYKLTVDGQVGATGFVNTSDLRKKNIMGDVPMNLYNVANAPLFKFTWNDEKEYSGHHIGSAAQYWQTILPELVIQGSDADLTLAMQYDVIALASAITVAKTVVSHEERIILLERENEALKKEIADLKSA